MPFGKMGARIAVLKTFPQFCSVGEQPLKSTAISGAWNCSELTNYSVIIFLTVSASMAAV